MVSRWLETRWKLCYKTRMGDIVLATFNARYIHSAFGLRCLLANLGELRTRTRLVEFDLNTDPVAAVERLLESKPRVVGLGVYIWNAPLCLRTVKLLRRIAPNVRIVLGGPEVSHEIEHQEICALADCVVRNEGDHVFPKVVESLLDGAAVEHVIDGGAPPVEGLALPYDEYTAEDISRRILYVEASRGCPFRCEFCLSSLDVPVRQFESEQFMGALAGLIERGATQFKFVDRTFNLDLKYARRILDFCLQHYREGMFFHFEMVPDRLPDLLRDVIRQFPAGALQFEVGIQTFNPDVAQRISRRQNYDRTVENLRWLRAETGVHIHADLIVGLPGETLESFASGFNRLVAAGPQEIQVGILKRLRGAPLKRHEEEYSMVHNPDPPYELLSNSTLDFSTMQRMKRFAAFWDKIVNSGRFQNGGRLLLDGHDGAFEAFLRFSDDLSDRFGRSHAIGVDALAEEMTRYLIMEKGLTEDSVRDSILADMRSWGRRDTPGFLRAAGPKDTRRADADSSNPSTGLKANSRQLRHAPPVG